MKTVKECSFVILLPTFSLFLLLVFTSCGPTKESYLHDFRKFIEKTEKNNISYSETEWNEFEAEYADLTTERLEKVKDSFTSEDHNEFARLQGRYLAAQIKRQGNKLLEGGKEILEGAKGVLEGLGNDNKN
jgi:hypothetical protein